MALQFETRLAGIETKLAVLVWMVSFNLAMTLAVLWKVIG
jgi:hypothetical protein